MKSLSASVIAAILAFTAPLASALPSPQNFPVGSNIIQPTTISQYTVWTGAVDFNVAQGKIFKDGRTSDITTLVTFDFPPESAGKTCEFHFFLDSTATLGGSEMFDVFTSLAPATQSTTTWPNGNLRDQYLGRMQAFLPGEAVWAAGFPSVPSFPCPTSTMAGELVGTGDNDDIEWASNVAGPYIKFQ